VVWAKPEGGEVPVPVLPGESYRHPTDGVAVPSSHPDEVFKAPGWENLPGTDVDLVVNPDGGVSVPGFWDSLEQYLAEKFQDAGWKKRNSDWAKKHGDWNKLYD